MTAEQVAKILEGGGVDLADGAKVVTFQKALARAGVRPQDLAAAFQVQKALKAQGCSPEAIIEAVKQIIGANISLELSNCLRLSFNKPSHFLGWSFSYI